jgi:hypothetical protein
MIDGVIKLQTSGSSMLIRHLGSAAYAALLCNSWHALWVQIRLKHLLELSMSQRFMLLGGFRLFFPNASLGSSRPTAGPPAIDSYSMLKTHSYINLIILHHWQPKNIDIFMTPSVGQLVIFRNTWSIARRIGQVVEMMHCRTMTISSSAKATERKELQNMFHRHILYSQY